MRLLFFAVLLFLSSFGIIPEDEVSNQSQYGWPVFGNKLITGSFGEFRYYHFHMGMDFATEAKNGLPILAITDGKIVRIQSYKYSIGNAIFLKHDDGYTSRYGHLSKFSDDVYNALKNEATIDKMKKRFDYDYTFSESEQIRVKKGDVIAYSGDTGIGPSHLHLEITKDNIYYNPANFGINQFDSGKIDVFSLELKPENNKSFINGKNEPYYVHLKRENNQYLPLYKNDILIKGEVSISVAASELSGLSNRIGFQKMTTSLNGTELQEINFDKISSHHMYRSCFVLDNYKSRMNGRPFKYFLHTREGNNLLGTKNQETGAGLIKSSDLNAFNNEVEVKLKGLSTEPVLVKIYVLPDTKEYPDAPVKPTNINPDSFVTLSSDDKKADAFFPAYAVFSPEFFIISKLDTKVTEKELEQESSVYKIEPDYKEFNLGYDIYIKIDRDIEPQKFGLYQVTERGKIIKFISNSYYNTTEKFFRARVRATGNFAVLADHSKPELKISRYGKSAVFTNSDFKLYLSVKDTGSGVPEESIKLTIDGVEAYIDFDPERGTREIFYPDLMREKGKHKLIGTAMDRAGNVSELLEFDYEVKQP